MPILHTNILERTYYHLVIMNMSWHTQNGDIWSPKLGYITFNKQTKQQPLTVSYHHLMTLIITDDSDASWCKATDINFTNCHQSNTSKLMQPKFQIEVRYWHLVRWFLLISVDFSWFLANSLLQWHFLE